MKIMAYNILEGGSDHNGSRTKHIIEVIKKANPDFLALQEANGSDKNDSELLRKISAETALPHYTLAEGSLYGGEKRYHVVILSRYPLRGIHTFPNSKFQSAALSVIIDSPFGELSLCAVHLHDKSESERTKEARVILSYQSKFKQSIILGDFNALSRSDHYDNLSTPEFTRYDLIRFDATDMFSENYVDAVAHLNVNNRGTHPTIGVPHPISKNSIRIDYIFVTSNLTTRIEKAVVIKTPTAEKTSDHYPITLILE